MSKAEQRPAAMRESRDIEWLVNWALEKQGARYGGSIVETQGGGSGAPAWLTLGTRVDGAGHGGGGMSGRFIHEDAQIIADELGAMLDNASSREAAEAVARYGLAGIRPDWGADGCGKHELVRGNGGQGKAKKRYRDQRQARGLIGFEWSFVGHSVDEIEFLMLQWSAWHAALCDLREIVNAGMRTYVATGPGVSKAPWDAARHIDEGSIAAE